MNSEYRRICRHNVKDDLATLASPAAQLQFQRDVPFVNISVELFCNWFDGHFFPDEPEFVALFSAAEWQALTEFNIIFEEVSAQFQGADVPEIAELLETHDWQRVIEAAKIARAVLETQ